MRADFLFVVFFADFVVWIGLFRLCSDFFADFYVFLSDFYCFSGLIGRRFACVVVCNLFFCCESVPSCMVPLWGKVLRVFMVHERGNESLSSYPYELREFEVIFKAIVRFNSFKT